jgi:hypothetical protein
VIQAGEEVGGRCGGGEKQLESAWRSSQLLIISLWVDGTEEFGSRYVKFEMSLRHSGENVEETVKDVNLGLGSNV